MALMFPAAGGAQKSAAATVFAQKKDRSFQTHLPRRRTQKSAVPSGKASQKATSLSGQGRGFSRASTGGKGIAPVVPGTGKGQGKGFRGRSGGGASFPTFAGGQGLSKGLPPAKPPLPGAPLEKAHLPTHFGLETGKRRKPKALAPGHGSAGAGKNGKGSPSAGEGGSQPAAPAGR